ncbi:MAG: hypothetical protein KatS3mg096_875 [Candidatus Parcubacteria bacterium]|nr:MAG: hypothetical protein KatS3mg096_875 [Candidatus Parcubacteria bacterium]
MNVAVIGAGTYGSYIVNSLLNKFPEIKISLFEVGTWDIKNEGEIGYKSNVINGNYSGLSKGRFFGFGGTSAKWGGQLLTFSERDFSNPSPYLKDIVDLNIKYKEQIFRTFGIKSNYIERNISDKLFIKTGIWLSYFNRNLFKYFKINKRKNIKIISNARVIKILTNGYNTVKGIVYKQNGIKKEESFDHYFLAAGAFESIRILMVSGLLEQCNVRFSDHLSQKVFKIKGPTKINTEDFSFRIKGSSLITKRIIGEIDGVSFFVNPIFNSEFSFFNNLKVLLFERKFSPKIIKSVLKDLPYVFLFIWYLLMLRKIYVYKGEWYFYIDIENPNKDCFVRLSKQKDKFNEMTLEVNFSINKNTSLILRKVKQLIKQYLMDNNVSFEECFSEIQVEKYVDTYHPYGMICDFNSVKEYFNMFTNMLVVNTGILPRAGGINLTAAVFPLIEEYITNYFRK